MARYAIGLGRTTWDQLEDLGLASAPGPTSAGNSMFSKSLVAAKSKKVNPLPNQTTFLDDEDFISPTISPSRPVELISFTKEEADDIILDSMNNSVKEQQ
jgi:hypothetical protein